MVQKEQLIIFDTTLRDGEQSPGVMLTADEKVAIAAQLSRLGVDVCEAGFPIASSGDFEAVERIAKEVGPLMTGRKSGKPMVIAGLARSVPKDIQRAYDAVKHAPLHRIHVFLATSDIHLTHKLKISREECIARATAAVQFARSLGVTDIEFSPEDAGRSDQDFLCQVLGAVIEAGATTLNIPDTVGYNTPEAYGNMIKYLVENTPNGKSVIWSTHCHNDLGLATANTLAGVVNGARQVEVTINGIGERAGNTALEEIVMNLYVHPNLYPVFSHIDTTQLYLASQLVTKKTGMPIQPNKAIVGANAFAHESGIHQDGVLKHKATYEIMQPEIIGIPTAASSLLVLGKHSGRNALRSKVDFLLAPTPYTNAFDDPHKFESLFNRFKRLADTKKTGVTDADLQALIDEALDTHVFAGRETYRLANMQVVAGSDVLATATVSIQEVAEMDQQNEGDGGSEPSGKVRVDAAIGQGGVHAIFKAIQRLSVTAGPDALARVIVRLSSRDQTKGTELKAQGVGTDEDVLIASAKAYINGVNRIVDASRRSSSDKVNKAVAI